MNVIKTSDMKQPGYLLRLLCIAMFFLVGTLNGFAQFSSKPILRSANGVYNFNYLEIPSSLMSDSYSIPGTTYQWEKSDKPLSGYIPIVGATQAVYTFTDPLTQTTYFRRKSSLGTSPFNFFIYSTIVKMQVVSVNWENINYIREHNILKEGIVDWKDADQLPIGEKLQTTTYIDGMGRTLQKVSKGTATPDPSQPSLWGDIVQFSKYDALGREAVGYLPYTSSAQAGKYKLNPVADQGIYYTNHYGEPSAYTSSTFDNSPLNRIINLKSPGTSWANSNGHTSSYDFNNLEDEVQVFDVDFNNNNEIIHRGLYPINALLKTISIDENDNRIIEYFDKSNQLILKKIQLADVPSSAYDGWICLYNIYDEFGLLRYVIQPEGVKWLSENSWNFASVTGQKILDEWCFRYNYDEKKRTVLKKAPGAMELRMIYDNRNRLVFMQDGNQRAKPTPEWTANLFDEFDRPIITTLYTTSKTVNQLQADIDNSAIANSVVVNNPGEDLQDLLVNSRDPSVPFYKAGNSIEFGNGFESEAGGEFIAEIDVAAVSPNISITSIIHKSPISAVDLNNPVICTILNYNFYDNYIYNSVKSFNTNFDNGLANESGDPIVASMRTADMSTGSLVRVMGQNKFLATTLYYDVKGRCIQAIEDNIKGGEDVTTFQYKFDSREASNSMKHSSAATGYDDFSIVSRNVYDKIGRVIGVQKKYGINDFKAVATYEYDDIGRLKTKFLAPGYIGTGKNELESLSYSYNMHNRITGINKDYALKTPGKYNKWGNYFGMYLGYDNRDLAFANAQLNGPVTGIMWTTQGDDNQRKYDFEYDNTGRITQALFNEKQSLGDNWNHTKLDFTVSGNDGRIAYDLNGNLLSMLQKGVVPGSSAPLIIDDLQYSYENFTNKLKKVTDNTLLTSLNGALGDFKDGGNGSTEDYVYDENGNLVIDLNKGVKELGSGANGIKYNLFDKPEEVRIKDKGVIKIVYDGNGNKLQRIFTPDGGSSSITTTYIKGFVYKGNELQYINFEEGRIRVITPVNLNNGYDLLSIDGEMDLPNNKKGVYDFFLLDYQKNVRMILTDEIHVGSNSCTMETNRAANEEPLFGRVDANGVPSNDNEVKGRFAVSSIPGQANSNGWQNNSIGNYVSRIGNIAGSKVGPNALLKVMGGDEISATSIYYYQNPVVNQNTGTTLISNLLVSLGQALSGGGMAGSLVKNSSANITSLLSSSSQLASIVAPDASNASGTNPKAYLTILFFDERFNFVSEGSVTDRVIQAGNDASPLLLANIKAPKNGYAYVYLSNESDEMVYFDNFQVTHNRGRIIEENHYYAFGLKIAAISSHKAADLSEGNIDNLNLYNDKELIVDGDLGWYDYGFRNYDPQIGRFPQLDPLTYDYAFLTPYQYASNDPILNIDLDGLEGVIATTAQTAKVLQEVVVVAKVAKAASTTTRVWGAVKAVGSLIEIGVGAVGGAASSWTGIGAVVGAAAVVHGLDGFNTGMAQLLTGQKTTSLTERGISAGLKGVGVAEPQAEMYASYADGVIGIALGGGAGAASKASVWGTKVAARTGIGLADDFLASATKPWGEQGLTVVGRALQKHAGREGSVFQGVKFSHNTANQEGLNILNQIMNSPNKVIQQAKSGGQYIFDKITGRGFGVSREGLFNGFRELPK